MKAAFNSSLCVLALTICCLLVPWAASYADDADTYILAAGRRLPYLYAISLEMALAPANNNTPNAIVSRNKVAMDRLDGRPLGDPANLILSEDGNTVYVVNHHGSIDNEEFRQHGGRGQIAVLDVAALVDSRNDLTHNALLRHMDSGGFGALGVALLQDMLVISNAENNLTEDGGNLVTFRRSPNREFARYGGAGAWLARIRMRLPRPVCFTIWSSPRPGRARARFRVGDAFRTPTALL